MQRKKLTKVRRVYAGFCVRVCVWQSRSNMEFSAGFPIYFYFLDQYIIAFSPTVLHNLEKNVNPTARTALRIAAKQAAAEWAQDGCTRPYSEYLQRKMASPKPLRD